MMKNNEAPREENRPIKVHISDGLLHVRLQDGREIATPLEWYPSLMNATATRQSNVKFTRSGIYWPDLDEDLSIAGMLRGTRPPQRSRRANEST